MTDRDPGVSSDSSPNDDSEDLTPYLDVDYNQDTLNTPTADKHVSLAYGTPETFYGDWDAPDIILGDVTGVLAATDTTFGFITELYPHLNFWTANSAPGTTLWVVVPEHAETQVVQELLDRDWDHRTRLTWVRDRDHTPQPTAPEPSTVTTSCLRFVLSPTFPEYPEGTGLAEWVRSEWARSGISDTVAEKECSETFPITEFLSTDTTSVPPFEVVDRLRDYANEYGETDAAPYFALPDDVDWTADWWDTVTPTFTCDADLTSLWGDILVPPEDRERSAASFSETVPPRVPVSCWRRLIDMTTDPGEMVWVPFAGHGRACVAAKELGRECRGACADRDAYRVAKTLLSNAVFGRGDNDTQSSFTDF